MSTGALENDFGEADAEWREMLAGHNRTRNAAFAEMVAEQARLTAGGRWLGGKTTLLHALGLQYSEVKLCAGIAWLLTPGSWHRLDTKFLSALLLAVGFEPSELSDEALRLAQIVTEERRDDGKTRADIVIRIPELGTVLIEAKVFAREQGTQADRLYINWQEETPRLVYLTREHGRLPDTAKESGEAWTPLSWSRLARLLEPLKESASDGARDLIDTLTNFGG